MGGRWCARSSRRPRRIRAIRPIWSRITVGDGYTIAIENHAVMVHAGARSAWLAGNAEGLTEGPTRADVMVLAKAP